MLQWVFVATFVSRGYSLVSDSEQLQVYIHGNTNRHLRDHCLSRALSLPLNWDGSLPRPIERHEYLDWAPSYVECHRMT